MGFDNFYINNKGKKEHLNNAKHGVRKEQVDKKFHNLFDAYDGNNDGTLEENEVQTIFGHLKNFAGDNVLDSAENLKAKSVFAEQVNMQDVDFQGFVKSISDATSNIISSEETKTSDGGKEIKTEYKDGTTETIAYYSNGDFKWKKIEKRFTKTTYEMILDGKRQELTEEQYNQALKKLNEKPQPQQKPKATFGIEGQKRIVFPQPTPSVEVKTTTNKWEEHTQEYSPRFIAEKLGVDINTDEGKKILERMSYLPKEALDQIKDGAELKDVLSSNELTSNFDNISNVLELMYGVTLRNEEEYEASKPQREKIVQQIQTVGIMSELYARVAEFNDTYTDNQGVFGLGSEGIGWILNKIGIQGENHYQWADSCREFIEKINDFKVLNPAKFEEEFKELTGKEKFNVEALQKMVELAKDGKAQDEYGDYTDEYKQAVKEFSNFDVTNINARAWYHPLNLLNGFGEVLAMIATLGWGAETKAGQMLATSTMATFGKAGVTIASKQVNNRLLQGALRLSGKGVKLLAPMINEGTKMYAYTAVTGTASNITNRAIKFDSEENSLDKFLQTEAMVLDSATGSFGFGAFAGAFGSTVTQKVMQRASKVSQKVGTALSDKFAKGAVDANEVFTTILEKSAPTKIAEVAAFATDVLGFTAFESVLAIVKNLDNFPDGYSVEDLTNIIWEELKSQGYNLGQIKIVAWLMSSRSARMQATRYMKDAMPQLRGATVEGVNGGKDGYKINLPDGRKVECKNTTEYISALHLMVRGETAFSKKFDVRTASKGTETSDVVMPPNQNVTTERTQELPASKEATRTLEIIGEDFGLDYDALDYIVPENFPKTFKKQGLEFRKTDTTYEVYNENGEEIGYCTIFEGVESNLDLTPNSWIENGTIKPYLEIGNIFTDTHGKGNGRRIMQALHELSKDLGYEGRIHLQQWESANGYYTKLGFLNDGHGSRFFDPTPESLNKLYQRQEITMPNLKTSIATESDLSVVHRMDLENFEGRGYNISENFAEYKADLENHGIETHVLKNQEGQVIGYYQLEPINGDELYIYSIGVPKEFQNTRSSYSALKTMQEEIANLAREKGLSKVTLDVESNNPKLVKLYKKFGFEEKGQNADGDIHMEADVKKVLGISEVSEVANTESVNTKTDLQEKNTAETKEEEKITPPQNTLVSSIMSKNTKVYTKDEILRVLKNYKVTDEKIIAELLELPYVQEMAKIYDFYYETNGGYKGKENDFGYIDAMKGYAKNKYNNMFKTTEFLTKENYDRIKEMADETVDNIYDILYYANEFTISNAELLMKKFGRKLSNEDFEFIEYCTNRDGSLSEKAFEFYEKAYHSTRLLWQCRDKDGYFNEEIFDFGVKLINQLDSQETIRVGYSNNRTLTRLKCEDDVSYIVENCKNKDDVLNPDAASIALEYCTKDTDSSTLSHALKLKNDDGSFNIECFKKLMELNKKFGMTYHDNYILSSVKGSFYQLDAKNIALVYKVANELGQQGIKDLESVLMDGYDRQVNIQLRDLAIELINLPDFSIKDVTKVLTGCKKSKYRPNIEYIKNLYLDLMQYANGYCYQSIVEVLPYTQDFNRDFVTKLVKESELTSYSKGHLVSKTTINNTDLAEKLYFNKDFKFKSHIAGILEYINQGNKDLAEKLCIDSNYDKNTAIVLDIIRYANSKTSSLADKLYFSEEFPNKEFIADIISPAEHCIELAEKLCFSKDFPQKELIAEILRNCRYQSEFAERLCFDKDFPKEFISSVLKVTGNDVLEVAETLCFSKDFREKEYISEILKEIDEQNKSLALKLCFNKDFPKKLISSILSVTGGKNINIAEKLCFSNFPKEYISKIVKNVNPDTIDFAEKLCFSNFPKEYISKIVKNVNPDTIELADFLCFESQFPKENIHQILQYASNVKIDYAKKMCTEMKLPVEEIINRVKAGYRSEKHVEEHHELRDDAILHRDLLKTGLEDLSDKDIESTMNSSNTISTLFVLGKGNLESAFSMTIDGFKDVCSEISHMRISEDNLELLLRKVNPFESKKYNEYITEIMPLKQKLREIIGEEKVKQIDELQSKKEQVDIQIKAKLEQLRNIENYVELSNSIKQLQTQLKQTKDETKKPKIEEELKQKIAECNEILSRHPEIINLQNEIKELQKQSKILNGQAQSLYFSCDNVQEVKTLMGQINAKTKELNAFLKEFVDINPQQIIDKVRVLAAISSISTEEEMTQFINLIQPSSVESNKAWDEAVNKKIYQKIGIECDENLAKKLDLIHCKYLSKMMVSSDDFFKYMKVLVQTVKDNPDKSVQEIFDLMPQNIQTKQMLEQIGIDYEKWTKVDKNSYSTVRVKLDAEAARKKAINSLEEDLNDSLFGKLPENIHKEIIEDLKEIGVTFEKQRIDNFVGDGISRGQTDYYRLYKNGKPIEFGDLKSILSSIKKTINKNEFWSTTQSEQDVESARGTLYEHLTKLRAEDIEQALSMKDGEEVEIEIHKTDMYDVKKALGLGNDGQCCTALGKQFNEYSAPTYIMNKCIGAIELVDKGNFVGNTMIYIAYVDGKPALVLDNIELKTKYHNNDAIRDTFLEYAKKLCAEIGQPDLPIYAGPNRHKLEMSVYPKTKHKIQIVGNTGNQPIYIDYDARRHIVNGTEIAEIEMYKLR